MCIAEVSFGYGCGVLEKGLDGPDMRRVGYFATK